MSDMQEQRMYKSPVKKLAKFFEKSRDQWKAKCGRAKTKLKYLKNRVRDLENSREKWKQKAKKLEAEQKKLQAELESTKKELKKCQAELEAKKNKLQRLNNEQKKIEIQRAIFKKVPVGHQYPLGQIMWFISFVLSAATSFRAASQVMKIISNDWAWPLKVPSWLTGRSWVLRLGYYKLMRTKKEGNDWVWIVDHTVQVSAVKCLVILGLRLQDLPQKGNSLTHQDVEPIALLPVTKSNGKIVCQQLEKAVAITGVPREIVGDHGPDLKSGVEMFCRQHQQTSFIYDIKHKTASILKRVLKDDPDWMAFTQSAAQTKNQIQQTSLAALAPPNQRTKARYMNVDILINWGCKMLIFLDKQTIQPNAEFDQQKVIIKLAWVLSFREQLKEWKGLLKLVSTSENFVRKQGLYSNCQLDLEALLEGLAHTPRQKMVSTELITFVEKEGGACQPNERLLGSSEIIESVFGKLKRLEQDQAKSGFTSLLLSVAAMVSITTSDVVQVALETVSNKQVMLWKEDVLGKSVQAKRREAFAEFQKTESKLEYSSTALTNSSQDLGTPTTELKQLPECSLLMPRHHVKKAKLLTEKST